VVRGGVSLQHDDGETLRLEAGDLAIVRGPGPWSLGDRLDRPPQVLIEPGNRCTTLYGEPLEQKMSLGVRTWGHNPDGETMMLIGVYEELGSVGQLLLDALPSMIRIPNGSLDAPLIGLLGEEIAKDDSGQVAVLDRLLDLLVVTALRSWFAQEDNAAPPWLRANDDPIVGRALRLLFNNPAHPWTVASLASEIGVSRAALARRFTEMVGEPPITFLTTWRLSLAADLLRQPGATVGSVARQVGYSTPFALSNAFKRVHGVSPRQHRALAATG
jgi:AraC-like DNA-binding protein